MSKLTVEILEDDRLFIEYVRNRLAAALWADPEIRAALQEMEDEIINGTGESEPKGFLDADELKG